MRFQLIYTKCLTRKKNLTFRLCLLLQFKSFNQNKVFSLSVFVQYSENVKKKSKSVRFMIQFKLELAKRRFFCYSCGYSNDQFGVLFDQVDHLFFVVVFVKEVFFVQLRKENIVDHFASRQLFIGVGFVRFGAAFSSSRWILDFFFDLIERW